MSGFAALHIPTHSGNHVIRVFNSFQDARSVWLEFEPHADAYAFQSYWWLKQWYDFMGCRHTIQPWIVAVECADGEPLMLLPLAIEKRRLVTRLGWLGDQLSDYQGPLLGEKFSQRITATDFITLWRQRVLKLLPRFDVIDFEKQPESIAGQKNPFLYIEHRPYTTHGHYTTVYPPLSGFLKDKCSPQWRSNFRRKQRRLSEQGDLQFVMAGQKQDNVTLLKHWMQQKSVQFRQLGVENLFDRDGCREFFYYMTITHANDGLVQLSALKLDDRIIATHWGLNYKGRFYFLFPAYERGAYSRYSPGTILLQHLIQWCIEHEVEIFDFTIGEDSYKNLWCDGELSLYYHLQSKTKRGAIYSFITDSRRRLKRALKRSTRLLAWCVYFRALLGRWRHI